MKEALQRLTLNQCKFVRSLYLIIFGDSFTNMSVSSSKGYFPCSIINALFLFLLAPFLKIALIVKEDCLSGVHAFILGVLAVENNIN